MIQTATDQQVLQPTMGRRALADLFAARHYQRGAEIGVAAGHYAAWLLEANPELELLCVDGWHDYPGYRDFSSQMLAAFYVQARQHLARYRARAKFIRKLSVDAAALFHDASLDFVYIDAAHTKAAVEADLQAWVPKVRSGGIVAGHDYDPAFPGVIAAVNAYAAQYRLPLVILRGPDKRPSWAWDVL